MASPSNMTAVARRLDALGPSTALSTRLVVWAGATWAVHSLELVVFTFTRAMVDRDIGMGRLTLKMLGASTAIGLLVGGPLFGAVADARGRRTALVLAMTLSLLGFVLFAAARDQYGALVARIVAGVGLGGEVPAATVLVYELAPSGRRARSVALLQAFAGAGGVAGVLLAFFAAPVLGWRGLYVTLSALVLLVTVVRLALPESPLWLLSVGRTDEALATVTKLELIATNRCEHDQTFRIPLLDGGATRFRAVSAARNADATAPNSSLLVLFLLWATLTVSTFALDSYLPSLVSLKGFNVYAAWSTCALLYVAQIFGSILASAMLDRRHHPLAEQECQSPASSKTRAYQGTDGRKVTLVLFAVATAVFALGLSYLPGPASGPIVATGASLVSSSLAGVWSVMLAYTPEHFAVARRARGVGLAAAFGGLSGIFGAVVVFPRFYNVWMLSMRALAWIFGAVLVAVAAVLVPQFGFNGRGQLEGDDKMDAEAKRTEDNTRYY